MEFLDESASCHTKEIFDEILMGSIVTIRKLRGYILLLTALSTIDPEVEGPPRPQSFNRALLQPQMLTTGRCGGFDALSCAFFEAFTALH